MTNEAVITTLLGNQGDPIEVTVATGNAIPKGTIMKISSSPQTAAAATAAGDYVLGICNTEKTTTDGVTKVMVITHCVAEIYATAATGSMTLGKPVRITGANTVDEATLDTLDKSMEAFGIALETVAAGASGEVLINI